MGTFIGHILPGVGFVLVGLWHLFNTLRNYVEAPWNFQSRTWFPTRWKGKGMKYLELYTIIFGSSLSISAELFICPKQHQPFEDDWSIASDHLNNFEHSTISLFFLIFGLTCLCSDVLKIHVPRGLLNVIGAFALSQELMLFHFHSADHMGLEGHFHWLLQLPIAVGVLASLLEIVAPKAFVLSAVRAVSILFQGTWFIQMGLTLWIRSFVPTGCEMFNAGGHYEVSCGTHEAMHRAKALANLAFSWHLATILVLSMLFYVAMMYHHSRKQVQYEPLLPTLKTNGQHHDDSHHLKDAEAANSPRSSHDGGSPSLESDVEMHGMTSISLER